MVAGCGKGIGGHGLGIKDGVAGDSNLGGRSGRRSTQRSVAEWSAEPGAEAAQIRRAWGGGSLMRLPGLLPQEHPEGFAVLFDRPLPG